MNLLDKTFGASGKISIDLLPSGLTVAISDSEKLSDQNANFVIKPEVLIDTMAGWIGSPTWLGGVVTFLKAEIAALAAPAPLK